MGRAYLLLFRFGLGPQMPLRGIRQESYFTAMTPDARHKTDLLLFSQSFLHTTCTAVQILHQLLFRVDARTYPRARSTAWYPLEVPRIAENHALLLLCKRSMRHLLRYCTRVLISSVTLSRGVE